MRVSRAAVWAVAGVVCMVGALLSSVSSAADAPDPSAKAAAPAPGSRAALAAQFPNELCLGCHGNKGFEAPGPDGKMRSLYVIAGRFSNSVHGKRLCVECHRNITEIPHKKGIQIRVSCVKCHEDLWAAAKKNHTTRQNARLGVVVGMIKRYMHSIHAQPSIVDQSRTNATCYNCHNAHYIYPAGSKGREQWRLNLPNTCGKCHQKERKLYATSVHGVEVLKDHNPHAAVCSDCHTTHDIENPALAKTKLVITKNCGHCHQEALKTYTNTYHGQVNTLGYAYTAKCFDCHGSHTIQRVDNPKSTVYPTNRLHTCRKCHKHATKGFVTFEPHGTSHDFSRYPYIWIASKFMLLLLGGTFAFFWTHTALWFYREYKERKQRKTRPHVLPKAVSESAGKDGYYQRFPLIWRIAHLTFATSLMILALTGMSVFYAKTAWAPVVINALGGPKVAAIIHRVCAVIFASVFFAQLIYFLVRIGRKWRTFNWFGPTSLVPRLQDLWDIIAMFKWFFGMGPRPVFDRWTYWEKFDYWAPFWGVTIIGASGVMLWFPDATASVLPGWVFNVATIFHGEEALLAVLFLFTVHFFNNHFRPDKFPLDIVMFTGAVPLEEFRHEHAVEYDRLVKSGELSKYLVDVPSRPMTVGSKILGAVLITFGLTLLVLVLIGIISELHGA